MYTNLSDFLSTTAASGIGLAAAKKFARYASTLSMWPLKAFTRYIYSHSHGLHVCLADSDAESLKVAEKQIGDIAGAENVLSVVTDVSKLDQVERLRDEAMAKFGEASMTACASLCRSDLNHLQRLMRSPLSLLSSRAPSNICFATGKCPLTCGRH